MFERLTKLVMRTGEQEPLSRRGLLGRFGNYAAVVAGAFGAFLAFTPQAQAGCFHSCYAHCIQRCGGHTPDCEVFCYGQCVGCGL